MRKNEFIEEISSSFGNFTAYVFDGPNNRYTYSSGQIEDDDFICAPEEGCQIVGINDLPEVKKVITDNFLAEVSPAEYEAVKEMIDTGEAQVGYWTDNNETTYILIL